MDKEQLTRFKLAFKRANNGKLSLPNRIDTSKIYDIECYQDGMRGGYRARFFISKDDTGNYQLELFCASDYVSWHKRIDHAGNISDLDNYKGQFGWPHYPDDPERTAREHEEIRDFNAKLHQQLVEKGLEENTEDDEFEKAHVIVLRNYGF